MNNFVKTQLDKFEKPDKSFMLDKECLICLESVDLELNEIVKLPCNCSNSVYHIICIENFLKSGNHNNFCPHCKTKYVIALQEPIENYIVINRANDTYRLIKIKEIILVHIVSNSIMNIINLLIIRNDTNIEESIQVLALFYLCKIFLNFCIFLFSKNNTEKIEDLLICSYTYQIILIGFLIYSLTKKNNNYNTILLIINNIFFSVADILFRIIKQYNSRETQVAPHPIPLDV
jgi:hypothetical protein